jgi:glycosyltransferase involved in cell wall biosynthesis
MTTKGNGFYKDALVIGLVKLFGVRTVYHLHNKGVHSRQNSWFDHFLYKLVFTNSHVILLSPYLYPDVQKYIPPEKVLYCPNGIPPAEHKSSVTRPADGPAEILFLSNLMERKGVLVLLEACRILKTRGCCFLCRFVGAPSDVTERRFYAAVSAKGLREYVIHDGPKYAREKELCIAHAEIFAFPTYEDCFPLVLLEAMQFSLPVVSTCEGGIPDIVEDGRTGFLCPRRDVAAFADKLELLIKDKRLREQIGAAGYRKYQEEFTLQRFENRLKDILLSIIR